MHRDSILVRLSSFDNCETGGRRRRCCSSCNAGMKEAGGKMISLTKRTLIGATIAALALIVTPTATRAQSAAPALANFEPSQTNPIRLSAAPQVQISNLSKPNRIGLWGNENFFFGVTRKKKIFPPPESRIGLVCE